MDNVNAMIVSEHAELHALAEFDRLPRRWWREPCHSR
jgi:hypothetical protein